MERWLCTLAVCLKRYVVLTLCAVLLVACHGRNHDVAAKVRDTLVIGNGPGEVPTLDPGKWGDDQSERVLHDLFEGLLYENQKNEVLPGIAQSWDISKDGKTYIFHLSPNAKWSNGKPVTAGDFVYAFKRNIDPATGAQQLDVFHPILNAMAIISGKKKPDTLGIFAVDNNTLKIVLQYPYHSFLESLLNPIAYPLYKPVIKKWGDAWTKVGRMVSNGPYELSEWVPNGHILLTKNPSYWKKSEIKIKKIKFLPMTQQAEYSQFLADQIDMTSTVPVGAGKKKLSARFGHEFYNVPLLGVYFYWFNMKDPDVSKLAVRKALTITVNRALIVNDLLKLGQKPLYGQVPPTIQDSAFKGLYKHLLSYNWVNSSLDKRSRVAKAMLQQSGYSAHHPLRVTVSFNTSAGHKLIAEAIAEMWKKAFGPLIKISLNNEEWKVYLQSLQKGNYQIGRMGGIANLDTAGNFVISFLCDSPGNYGGYCNKKVDDYYYKSVRSINSKEADLYMRKALSILMNDYVTLPVYSYTYSQLVKQRVGGYHPEKNYMHSVYSKWLYFK